MYELHQAVAAGKYNKVMELLTLGICDPNEKDVDWSHKTPLHWAAEKGYTEIVRLLLEHGARPCLMTEHGYTAAHYAAECGHLATLELLHSRHAPIDKEDFCRDKPLRLAEIYGHRDCVAFLKKAGIEAQAYREMAAQKGIATDETDEGWEQQGKENKYCGILNSNIRT
ncbi:unnamed protein product [Ophioblennius macclurei]